MCMCAPLRSHHHSCGLWLVVLELWFVAFGILGRAFNNYFKIQSAPAGFRRLGFGRIISTLAVPFIHASFSYPTAPSILPDPFFR